jgi:hypothetical protein
MRPQIMVDISLECATAPLSKVTDVHTMLAEKKRVSYFFVYFFLR